MRYPRSLSKRILIISGVCGLIGLVTSQLLGRRTTRDALLVSYLPYLKRTLTTAEIERCRRDPAAWSMVIGDGVRLDAYDARTLASANPSSLPLDPLLRRKLLDGEDTPARLYRYDDEEGGALLTRTSSQGSCAIVQATWPPQVVLRRRPYLLFAVFGLGLGSAVLLGFLGIIRPLARRIDRLRRSATLVGSDRYLSAESSQSDELGEVSFDLDRAHQRIREDAVRLEDRQRSLERHLENVAHDLRTPLASLQIALEQASDVNRSEQVRDLLDAALKDTVYLSALTHNLRLASRLESGWDPVAGDPRSDLAAMVDQVVARHRFFARRRGIALEVARPDECVWVRCDVTAGEQAISNIVDNALAHGNAGGHVAVVLTAGPRFTLSVTDDGRGILPAELPRLGERTFRTDEARQRDPRGSGLGLAIAHELSLRARWELSFERVEPTGLRVKLSGAVLLAEVG